MSQPIAFPVFRAFDHSTGAPLAGGLVNFYVSRTAVRQNTYTDATLSVPNPNPVVLDANGEAQIWPLTTVSYTIVLTDSVGAVQWTINDWSASALSAQSLSGKNILLNGGQEIWQPAFSFVGANNLVLHDGWAMNLNGSGGAGPVADYTISRQTGFAVDSQYCVRIARNAASVATRQPIFVQNVETLDCVGIRGNTAVLTFQARAGANFSGGQIQVQLLGGFGAVDESYQTALALTNQFVIGSSALLTMTTSAQTFTVQFANVGNALACAALSFLCGVSQGTAGAADYIEFDDIKLEIGVSATPGIDGTADVALQRCQRRYFKTFPQSTAPAQAVGLGTGAYRFQQGVGAGAATQTPSFPQPSWMRDFVNGTLLTYNPVSANAQIRNLTVAADCSAVAAASEPTTIYAAFTSAGGSAAGNINSVHYTLDKRF